MNKEADMKNTCEQSTISFGSQYYIHIGVSGLSDNLENLVEPNTILFIDYVEKIHHINIGYELNKLLDLVDRFGKGDYQAPHQILTSHQEYFDNLDKNYQVIEKLFKDSGLENSLNLLKQTKLIKKEYESKIKKYIEIAKKYSLEEIEKITVEISKNFITKVGIPLLLYYLADIKQVKWTQKIAKLLLAKHPYTRLVLLILSCSIFIYEVYKKMKDKDKRIEFKNHISIYFGHILCIIDMMYHSYQSSYFINFVGEQYGAFRIENLNTTNNPEVPRIVIVASNTPIIFHSSEHLIEFSLSNQKTIDTKHICNSDRSFAQLSIFTGLNGAIYDVLAIQQNPIEYLFIKFYNFVQLHQGNAYNYISYQQVTPQALPINNQTGVSSSFEHTKNLFLKSHNFALVKTQSFSSIIIYDLLSQSLKISKQNNKPIKKEVLIITTPLHTESFEYQMQKHIKELCNNNTDIQQCVTFMTPICRIDKQQYFISLRTFMLDCTATMDTLVGDIYDDSVLAFLTNQRQAKIKEVFSRIFIDDKGFLKLKNIDYNELLKFYLELQDVITTIEFKPFLERNDAEVLVRKTKTKYPNDKDAVKKAFEKMDNNFQLLISYLNDLSVLISYFVDGGIGNIEDFKKDLENKKNDIKQVLEKNKNKFPNSLIALLQFAIHEYFSFQNHIKDNERLEQQIINIYKSSIDKKETYSYIALFDSIDHTNTNIIIKIVEKILPIPHYIFTKLLTEESYTKFCHIVFIESIRNNRADLLVGAILISQTTITIRYEAEKSHANTDILLKNLLNNIQKTLGDKAIASFFHKATLTNSAISLIFGINQPEDMIQSVLKNFIERSNISSYKISLDDFKSFGINFLIDFTIDIVFDFFFPSLQRDSLREDIAMLLLLQRRYKPMPYAKWEKNSPYAYFPETIAQTFVSADFTAMLIGGSPFNSGWCIHNPSIAGFVQDKDLAREHTLKMLKKYVCGNKYSHVLPLNAFHTQTDSIFKEAYCKVLCYLDLATDEHVTYLCTRIPNATKESITKLFNSQTLMDTTNLIKTKIKINSKLDNDDKSFITSRAMSYSRDFLIQLKRVAEYNYLTYNGSFDDSLNRKSPTKREAEMLGSLIYDKGFIPTTIDVRD